MNTDYGLLTRLCGDVVFDVCIMSYYHPHVILHDYMCVVC